MMAAVPTVWAPSLWNDAGKCRNRSAGEDYRQPPMRGISYRNFLAGSCRFVHGRDDLDVAQTHLAGHRRLAIFYDAIRKIIYLPRLLVRGLPAFGDLGHRI